MTNSEPLISVDILDLVKSLGCFLPRPFDFPARPCAMEALLAMEVSVVEALLAVAVVVLAMLLMKKKECSQHHLDAVPQAPPAPPPPPAPAPPEHGEAVPTPSRGRTVYIPKSKRGKKFHTKPICGNAKLTPYTLCDECKLSPAVEEPLLGQTIYIRKESEVTEFHTRLCGRPRDFSDIPMAEFENGFEVISGPPCQSFSRIGRSVKLEPYTLCENCERSRGA